MITKEELENQEPINKGETTARWKELTRKYEERLDKANAALEKYDKLHIYHIEYTNQSLFENLWRFEALSEKETEILEIYKIKYSGHYVVIIGPVSERRSFKVLNDIEI